MFKNNRYINAGQNEIYRYGRKAIEKASKALEEHNGYFSIPCDGGRYWTIGTSTGKYGEFCKMDETLFSVNRSGYAYAKAGTEKADAFKSAIQNMIARMNEINDSRFDTSEEDNEE